MVIKRTLKGLVSTTPLTSVTETLRNTAEQLNIPELPPEVPQLSTAVEAITAPIDMVLTTAAPFPDPVGPISLDSGAGMIATALQDGVSTIINAEPLEQAEQAFEDAAAQAGFEVKIPDSIGELGEVLEDDVVGAVLDTERTVRETLVDALTQPLDLTPPEQLQPIVDAIAAGQEAFAGGLDTVAEGIATFDPTFGQEIPAEAQPVAGPLLEGFQTGSETLAAGLTGAAEQIRTNDLSAIQPPEQLQPVVDGIAQGQTALGAVVRPVSDIVTRFQAALFNDAPEANAATNSVLEDSIVSGRVTATDPDFGDTESLTFEWLNQDEGLSGFTLESDGTYTFNTDNYDFLAEGVEQTVVFQFIARDRNGVASEPQTLSITVRGTNDKPIAFSNNAGNVGVFEDETVEGQVFGADVDIGDEIRFRTVGEVPDGFVLNEDGTFALNAANYDSLKEGEPLRLVVNFEAFNPNATTDAVSEPAELVIFVTGRNDTPVVNDVMVREVNEDGNLTGTLTAQDADAGETETLTFELAEGAVAPEGFELNSNGTYTFDASSYDSLAANESLILSIPVVAVDINGAASEPKVLQITVIGQNDAPIAVADMANAVEDRTVIIDVLANDTDVDNAAADLTIASATVDAALGTVMVVDNKLVFSPAANYNGPVVITYTTFDGIDESEPATVSVMVRAVNDAPVGVDSTVDATEDTSFTFSSADFGFSDVESNALEAVKVSSLPTGGVLMLNGVAVTQAAINKGIAVSAADLDSGALTFTPAENFAGTVTFGFQVVDNGGNTFFAVTADNQLVELDSSYAELGRVQITGLAEGESVLGIDIRPTTGDYFAVGSQNNVYTINPDTGAATFAFALTGVDFTNGIGVDFNPAADHADGASLRITTGNGINYAVNVNNGTVAFSSENLPDGTTAAAYTNAGEGRPSGTSLYYINSETNELLFAAGDFNNLGGTATPPTTVLQTIGVLGVDVESVSGFEITTGGQAVAALKVGGVTGIYNIDLATGAATLARVVEGDLIGLTQGFGVNTDQTRNTMTITVANVNDAPTVSTSMIVAEVDEAADASMQNIMLSGAVVFNDVDAGDVVTLTSEVVGTVRDGGNSAVVPAALKAALEAAFSVPAGNMQSGTVDWTFNAQDLNLDFLAVGESISVTFKVIATDAADLTAEDTVTIKINGTFDAAIVPGPNGGTAFQYVSPGGLSNVTVGFGTLREPNTQFRLVDENGDILEVVAGRLVRLSDGMDVTPEGFGNFNEATGNFRFNSSFFYNDADRSNFNANNYETFSFDYVTVQVDANGDVVEDADGNPVMSEVKTFDFRLVGTDVIVGDKNTDPGYSVPGNDLPVMNNTITEDGVGEDAVTEITGKLEVFLTRGVNLRQADTMSGPDGVIETNPTNQADYRYELVNGLVPPNSGDTRVITTQFGVFELTQGSSMDKGSYRYTFNNSPEVQKLSAGQVVNETFQVMVTRLLPNGMSEMVGTEDVIVRIVGTNDAPQVAVLMGDAIAGSVTESAMAMPDPMMPTTATGTFSFTDIDTMDVMAEAEVMDGQGQFGTLTAMVVNQANNGVANGVGKVQWVYTLDEDAANGLTTGDVETETFTIRVSDGKGGFADRVITVTINGANDGPVFNAALTAMATENGAPVTLNLLDGAVDLDGGTPAIVANSILYDVFVLDAEGMRITPAIAIDQVAFAGVTFDPMTSELTLDPNDSLYDLLPEGTRLEVVAKYTVTDGQGANNNATASIVVTGVNDTPVVMSNGIELMVDEGQTPPVEIVLTNGVVDIDGDQLSVVADSIRYNGNTVAPDGFSLVGNQLVVDPASPAFNDLRVGDTRVVIVSYMVTDGRAEPVMQTAVVTVVGTNDMPMVAPDAAVTANEDSGNLLVNLLMGATDPDTGDELTVVNFDVVDSMGNPVAAGFTVSPEGVLTVDTNNAIFQSIPAGVPSAFKVTYQVQDDSGAANNTSATRTLTVNIIGVADAARIDDVNFAGDNITVTATDLENSGQPLELVRIIRNAMGIDEAQSFMPAINLADNGGLLQAPFMAAEQATTPSSFTLGVRRGTLTTTTGVNVMEGTAGNDELTGSNVGSADRAALYGFGGNDTLNGGVGDDALVGGDGDDVMVSGGGADVIDGGAGTDTASFATNAEGVEADLSTGKAVSGSDTSSLISIENLVGSASADELTGDLNGNAITGGAGDDIIDGGDGDDTIDGGAGNDQLFGGNGNDTFVSSADSDEIQGGDGTDTVVYDRSVTFETSATAFQIMKGADEVDLVSGVERLIAPVSDGMGGTVDKVFLLVGNGGFGSIQDAVNAATGSEIIIVAGSFNENVNIDSSKAGLTIRGLEGSELTGNIFIGADQTSISGLTVLEGAFVGGERAGIIVAASDVVLSDLMLSRGGDQGTAGGGAQSFRGIINNSGEGANLLVSNVTVTNFATGVFLNPGAVGARVENSTLVGNFVGLSNDDPDNFMVSGTMFENNFEQIGLGVVDLTEDLSTILGEGNTFVDSNPLVEVPNVSIYPLAGVLQTITGTAEADQFNGDQTSTNGAQVFDGGAGDDTINMGGGNDIADGGEGNDIINLGAGDDVAIVGAGNDVVDGGTGIDSLSLGTANFDISQLTLGAGSFTLTVEDLGSVQATNVEKVVAANGNFLIVGSGGFASIQDAVDEASMGDTIIVSGSGSPYNEVVDINTAGLKIVGAEGAIVNGAFHVRGDNTTIQSIRVLTGADIAGQFAGIYINAANVTLASLMVEGTAATSVGAGAAGIVNETAKGAGLTVTDVTSSGFDLALYLNPGAEGVSITGGSFTGNVAGAGIDRVQDATLTDATFDGGVVDLELFGISGEFFEGNGNILINGTLELKENTGPAGIVEFGLTTLNGVTYDGVRIGSDGTDTFGEMNDVGQNGGSTAAQISDADETGAIVDGTVFGFQNAPDLILEFKQEDLLDVVDANSASKLGDVSINVNDALIGDTTFVIFGSWDEVSQEFTVSTTFDAMNNNDALVVTGDNVASVAQTTGYVLLKDLEAELSDANFV